MSIITTCPNYQPMCRWPNCNCFRAPTYPQQPVWSVGPLTPQPRGCICPPGSEATCKGDNCPRQPAKPISAAGDV